MTDGQKSVHPCSGSALGKVCDLRKCQKARLTESEFVRRAALEKNVVVIDGAAELLTELRRQGNNLNQLTILARNGESSWWTSNLLWRCIRTHGER